MNAVSTSIFAAALAVLPVVSQAAVIDFTALPGGQSIDQTYGDVAGVLEVTYEVSFDGGFTFAQDGFIWLGGYDGLDGDNTNALIAPTGGLSIMQITLQALNGNAITSFGASVAYWDGIDLNPLTISLFADGGLVYTTNNVDTPNLIGVSRFGGPWTTAVLQLGDDWDVGYQSVSYTVALVPLPAGGVLLLGALGGLAALRRRRRAA